MKKCLNASMISKATMCEMDKMFFFVQFSDMDSSWMLLQLSLVFDFIVAFLAFSSTHIQGWQL